MTNVKVLLLGDECTKTSSFALHWMTPEGSIPVISDTYKGSVNVSGQELLLELSDTDCSTDFAALREMSYLDLNPDIVLLFFSYDSVESLEHVPSIWVPEITETVGRPLVFMLVGVGFKLMDEDYELLEAMGECPFGDCPVKNEMVQKVIADIEADGFMYCCKDMKRSFEKVVDKAAEIYMKKKEAETKKKEEEFEKKKHKRRWWQRKDKGKK